MFWYARCKQQTTSDPSSPNMPTHQSLYAGLCGKYLEVSILARPFCQVMMVTDWHAEPNQPLQQRASDEQCTHYMPGSSNKRPIRPCWVGSVLQGGNRMWAWFRWEGDWVWGRPSKAVWTWMTGENYIACAEPLEMWETGMARAREGELF